MASERDIIIAMQEAVRKALSEAANEEIDKLIHRFECRMGDVKREMIGKILNSIDIATSHNPETDGYMIQVNIKK